MYAFYHVWLRGNTIIHPAPVGLSIEGWSCCNWLVGITAISCMEEITTALHCHVKVVIVCSMLKCSNVSSFLRKSKRLFSCENRGDNIVVKHWVCPALAYDVDSVSIKWKRGNLSLV